MEAVNKVELSYEDLASYTDNFSEESYLGYFQFGKFYRGKIDRVGQTQHVMVKIWEVPEIYNYYEGDNQLRLIDEMILLCHEKLITHPGMVKLYGYCVEGDHLGLVYDFKPLDSVCNLIPKESFTWLQRMRVALRFAAFLKYLHSRKCLAYKPFTVRNLDAAHIVLDEDYNPKLCDFGLITGGIFPDRTIYKNHHNRGCRGYIDFNAFGADDYFDKVDVFAFGTILLSLISMRVHTEEKHRDGQPFVYDWACEQLEEYVVQPEIDENGVKRPKFTIVHQSLTVEPGFCPVDGHKLSLLGVDCVVRLDYDRPNMKEVLTSLLKLNVVKKHADYLGVSKWFKN